MSANLQLHELHYNLGHLLHRQGDFVGAADAYRRAIALSPQFAAAHHSLGVVQDAQGQRAAAIRSYERAIALRPDYVNAYNNLGCTLAQQEQYDRAIQVYRQAIALQPHSAVLYTNLGQVLEQQDPAAAMAAYRRALELQPDLALAHYNLGKLLQKRGQHGAAIRCFQQGLRLSPTDPAAQTACGLSWMAEGEMIQGLQCFQQAIAPQWSYIQAYCNWAAPLLEDDALTRARKACAAWLQALHLAAQGSLPWSAAMTALGHTYRCLAELLMLYGGHLQYRQAEAYYQKALQLQPDDLNLHLGLAHCLQQQERFAAATALYHWIITLCPQDPQAYQHLGLLLEYQQRCSEAIRYYQQALRYAGKAKNAARDAGVNTVVRPRLDIRDAGVNVCAAAPPCDGLNCRTCLRGIEDRFQPVQLRPGVYQCTFGEEVLFQHPSDGVRQLPEGRAGIIPYENPWKVANAMAVFAADGSLQPEVSRAYPGQLPNCQQPAQKQQALAQHLSAINQQPLESVEGRVAVLAGLSGHTYFHWMVDILPRLEILRRSGIALHDIDRFWLNYTDLPFQQQTLAALDIPTTQILSSDRHPHIQAETLIVPSVPGALGWLEPWALDFLRQTFLPMVDPSVPRHERIYISRHRAHHRRVLNEAAVLERLRPLGVVPIELERLSVPEQIALFAHAKVIIAPHGGGLTNSLFCAPGTTIVEFFAPDYVRHYYWPISQQLGLHHYYLLGDALNCPPVQRLMYPSPLMTDIWVDLTALDALLRCLGIP